MVCVRVCVCESTQLPSERTVVVCVRVCVCESTQFTI